MISVHGPPGVGKSFLHSVLADALFAGSGGARASLASHAWAGIGAPNGTGGEADAGADATPWLFRPRCTRSLCPAYRILFGTSYLSEDADRKFSELRHNLVRHVRGYRESLVVIEEYDKMDCRSRGLLRELIDHALAEKIQWGRSIVVLESNTGYLQLMQLLRGADAGEPGGGRAGADDGADGPPPAARMRAEEAQKVLKDLVFDTWRKNDIRDCREDRVRTLRTLGMIDMFVPFFPLRAEDIRALFEMLLRARAHAEAVQRRAVRAMTWDEDVVAFLASRVEYEDGFAIEGAKEGRATMSRHVTRAIHAWNSTRPAEAAGGPEAEGAGALPSIHLRLSADASRIVCDDAEPSS